MKSIIFSCLLLISGFIVTAQTKHALLIGIGDYDTKVTNWQKLNSVRDVEIVEKTLERQEFKSQNIYKLINNDATKEGIIKAFKDLISKVNANSKDVVYIHVSSHGAQIEDDANKDETDNLDEAIVTINAKWSDDPREFKSLQGDYLRDDEVGELIEQLRAKLGKDGDVAVFMDLCHSGTATRGELVARGNKSPLVSPTFKSKNVKNNLKEFRENTRASRGDNSGLARYVVFSAARAEESAYETVNDENQKMGALTYAFCKAMENISSSVSYRTLFARVEAIMDQKSNIQHPVLEGSGIDFGFLGGDLVLQKPYVVVENVDELNNVIRIKGGSFAGISEGAGITFYPSGTSDPAKAVALAKGKVIAAKQFSADVSIENNPGKTAKDLWAFVTEPVFKVKPLVINIYEEGEKGIPANSGFSKDQVSAFKSKLKPLSSIKYSDENADLLLVKGTTVDSLFVGNTGYLFATANAANLEEKLKLFSKYRYLKDLEVKDPTIKVDVRLGKLKNGKVEFLKPAKTVKGQEFVVGEKLIVAVKNLSKIDVYVNILDFEPGGKVNPIFPSKGIAKPIDASELKIPAGKEIIFKDYIITIGPPLGSEVFKVFVSDQEIDMEGVARDFKGRNFMKAMELLVDDADSVTTRGGDVMNLKDAKGVVFNIPFQIKAKQ